MISDLDRCLDTVHLSIYCRLEFIHLLGQRVVTAADGYQVRVQVQVQVQDPVLSGQSGQVRSGQGR